MTELWLFINIVGYQSDMFVIVQKSEQLKDIFVLNLYALNLLILF